MGVEHGDRVDRPHAHPGQERVGVRGGERVQHQRWEGEVVDAVHLLRDLDLLAEVGVHLDQHLEAAVAAPRADLVDEPEGLRGHERGQTRCLHRVADRVQSGSAHPRLREPVQHPDEVLLSERVPHVDVNLLWCERRPYQPLRAVGELERRERQPGTRPV